MYSDVKNVRILIALLKEFGIRTAVLSSGTCSIPVIHSMEIDPFFECYSNIDERSAVFFAIGIAQMRREPIAVVCTSGTAACNYLPGIVEAMRQRVPLAVITCDKDPDSLGHLTIQKINQKDMYVSNCKKSVCIPVIKDRNDEWAARIMISQALLEVNHNGQGPVQINIYTDGDKKTFNTPSLPRVKAIRRLSYLNLLDCKKQIDRILREKKKILVVTGESNNLSTKCVSDIEAFCNFYGAVWSAEHVANTHSDYSINTYRVFEQTSVQDFKETLKPDLIISMGENFASYGIKSLLKQCKVDHWWIDPKGRAVDAWRSIDTIFECNIEDFFGIFNSDIKKTLESEYQKAWKRKFNSIKVPTEDFTSLYVVKRLCERINECTILHMGILNSTRLVHLFNIPRMTKAYSNLGALGIDGSLSTFLGQAKIQKNGIALCVIGDLSFFYDINSLHHLEIPTNVRIVLLNNGGGSEFHLNTGIDVIPMLDDFISAGHSNKAYGWAKANSITYLSAKDEHELTGALDVMFSGEGAMLLEVTTDIEKDSYAIKEMYKSNGYHTNLSNRNAKIKKVLTKLFGVQRMQRIVRVAKVWREK